MEAEGGMIGADSKNSVIVIMIVIPEDIQLSSSQPPRKSCD